MRLLNSIMMVFRKMSGTVRKPRAQGMTQNYPAALRGGICSGGP